MIERFREIIREEDRSKTHVRDLPIFMGHGNGDPRVKWNWGDRTQEALKEMNFGKVEFNTYR